MTAMPENVRGEVIAELYRQFDDMSWEERTQPEVSAAYERFLEDPKIGGRLKAHVSHDRIRVWIKDGPAKEYRRALEGVGPYAEFTRRQAVGPETVVAAALGRGWSVVSGSVGHKPMRCMAQRRREKTLVIWGPEKALKELFWHASLHVAEEADGPPVAIALTKRGNAPIDATIWNRAQSLAKVIGAHVSQTSLAVTWKPSEN